MSAFTQGFNFGFANGMFNSMFSGFNMPCCNFFTPTFFTPMMNFGSFGRYVQPMPQVNMPIFDFSSGTNFSMPSFSMPSFNSMPNFNFDFPPMTYSMYDTFTRSSSSSGSNSSYKATKAVNYRNMSDSEMRRIYGNYTKNITAKFNGNAADIDKHLKNRGVLKGKGQAFINAQNKYGISASVLAAICIQETGGTSSNAKNKNNVSNISQGKGWRSFSSVEECIDYTAKLLKDQSKCIVTKPMGSKD